MKQAKNQADDQSTSETSDMSTTVTAGMSARELYQATSQALHETNVTLAEAQGRIERRAILRRRLAEAADLEADDLAILETAVRTTTDAHNEARAQARALRNTPAAKQSAALAAALGEQATAKCRELDEFQAGVAQRKLEREAEANRLIAENAVDEARCEEISQIIGYLEQQTETAKRAAGEEESASAQRAIAQAQQALSDAEAEAEKLRSALSDVRHDARERLALWPELAQAFADDTSAARREYRRELDPIYQTLLAYDHYLDALARHRSSLVVPHSDVTSRELMLGLAMTDVQLKMLLTNVPAHYRMATHEGIYGLTEEPDRWLRERQEAIELLLHRRANELR